MISELTGRVASPSWKQNLFVELIELAKASVGEIDYQRADRLQKNTLGEFLGCRIVLTRGSDPSPGEADAVRADIVEAFALAGDLVAAEKFAESISTEGHDDAVSARRSIIKGWARKDPGHALKLASATIKSTYAEYVDEDEQKEQRENAMFVVLETIAETSKPDEVRKLADRIIRQSNQTYERNVACVIRVRATAATGKINEARKMATEEKVPCNQIPEHLAVYKFSRAVEDIEAARSIAEKYDYEPYEQWLKIAEATREPQDIARARAEIAAIPTQEIEKGWTADFRRNFNLLALAKISGDLNDIAVAREGILANPQSADSLFMELCRITRDRNDFALLLESTKREYRGKTDRYSALACIAEITQEELDFIAASKAALEINDPPQGVSAGYLRGRSLAELAQVLCGKLLHR